MGNSVTATARHEGRDCRAAEVQRTFENAPRRADEYVNERRRFLGALRRAASTCIRGVTGVRNALALQRQCSARGAHVASPMVGGRLKGSPCLQCADERHTLVNALGRTSYTPNPRSPEGFRNPAQSAPESPCPGRGSRCVRPGAANRAGLLFVVVLWLNLLLLLK
jgi:hypothetical protein